MSLGTIILIILIIVLLGGAWPYGPYPDRGHFYGSGSLGGSVLGTVLVIVLILVLLGHI